MTAPAPAPALASLRELASQCAALQESARAAHVGARDAVEEAVEEAVAKGAAVHVDSLRAEIDERARHCDIVASGCLISIDGVLALALEHELEQPACTQDTESDVCERVERALALARTVDLAFLCNVSTHAPLLVRSLEALCGDGDAATATVTSAATATAVAASDALVVASARGDAELIKLLLIRSWADPRFGDGAALVRAVESGCADAVRVLLSDPRVNPLQGNCAQIIDAIARERADIVTLLLQGTTPGLLERYKMHDLLNACIVACTTPPVWRAVLAHVSHVLDPLMVVHAAAIEGAHEVLLDVYRDCRFTSLSSCPSVSIFLQNRGSSGTWLLYSLVRLQMAVEMFFEPCFLELLASVPVTLSVDAISAAWKRSEVFQALKNTPLGAAKRAALHTMQQLAPALRDDVESWFAYHAKHKRAERSTEVFFVLKKRMLSRSQWIRARISSLRCQSMEVLSRADFEAGVACLKERYSRVVSILLTPACA
jgi:hypothetical protein